MEVEKGSEEGRRDGRRPVEGSRMMKKDSWRAGVLSVGLCALIRHQRPFDLSLGDTTGNLISIAFERQDVDIMARLGLLNARNSWQRGFDFLGEKS